MKNEWIYKISPQVYQRIIWRYGRRLIRYFYVFSFNSVLLSALCILSKNICPNIAFISVSLKKNWPSFTNVVFFFEKRTRLTNRRGRLCEWEKKLFRVQVSTGALRLCCLRFEVHSLESTMQIWNCARCRISIRVSLFIEEQRDIL